MNRKIILCCAVLLATCGCATRAKTFQVAPADVKDETLWRRVQETLQREPVDVVFADGEYVGENVLSLRNLGHEQNLLTLRAKTLGGAVFRDEPGDRRPLNSLMDIHECRNVLIRDLTFSCPQKIGAALRIFDCQDVQIESCGFIDLPEAYYCALSITGDRTDHVVVRHSLFQRVGQDAHAHMIYTAYGPQHVYVVENEFEDCAGDFVRFRDESDYGVVFGCTFKSTGTFRNANPPMITVPLFNDDNPTSRPAKPNYEYFGTHFLFANNTFEYSADHGVQDTRFAHVFHHSGYDPPGRYHLLTSEQAETLKSAAPDVRKKLLKDHTGIDLDEVHIFGRTYRNVDKRLVYRTSIAYGAESRGFSGVIDLCDLVNETPVVKSLEEAMNYFKR